MRKPLFYSIDEIMRRFLLLLATTIASTTTIRGSTVNNRNEDYNLRVQQHFASTLKSRALIFKRAANAQRRLSKHKYNGPIPRSAYVYGDKEASWDNTQALVDWAEDRPHTPEARRLTRQREKATREAAALLEIPTSSTNDDSAANSMLRAWRLKVQDKIDEQEKQRLQNSAEQNKNARAEVSGGATSPSYEKINKKRVDDVLTKLLSSSGKKKNDQNKAISFLETGTKNKNKRSLLTMRTRTKQRKKGFLKSIGKAMGKAGKAMGKAMGALGMGGGSDQKCIMCLFFMERLEQKVGFPSHDLHGNPESSSVSSTYPGPASYEKGAVESQPQYSPIPGPGYSGSFIEISSKHRNPSPPSFAPNDYQTLISNKNNLKQRLARNYNLEPTEHENEKKEKLSEKKMIDSIQLINKKNHLNPFNNIRFLDTKSLSGDIVGGGVPASSNNNNNNNNNVESMMSVQESVLSRNDDDESLQLTNQLAAAYDAQHDPFLGLRPEDAQQAATDTKILSLLELKTKQKTKGFISTLAAGAAGAAGAMGMGIKCPEGMPFCRKALRRVGRRSLSRRERRAAKNKEMSDTMDAMQDVLDGLKGETQYFGSTELATFTANIKKIATEYLHDYSDEEICSDINMCTVGNNPGQLPISQSAFSTIRL